MKGRLKDLPGQLVDRLIVTLKVNRYLHVPNAVRSMNSGAQIFREPGLILRVF